MVAVTEFSWEEVSAHGTSATGCTRGLALRRCRQVADKAKGSCRSAAAVSIARSSWCWPVMSRCWPMVRAGSPSQSNGTTAYQVVNGHCECRDFEKAPHDFCKHRLGAAIARRAQELLQAQAATARSLPAWSQRQWSQPLAVAALLPESLLPYVVHIKGKAFIQYGGLLTLAHSRGLVSLKVDFISVTSELALARAEAVFADGRIYAECADATPAQCRRAGAAALPTLGADAGEGENAA